MESLKDPTRMEECWKTCLQGRTEIRRKSKELTNYKHRQGAHREWRLRRDCPFWLKLWRDESAAATFRRSSNGAPAKDRDGGRPEESFHARRSDGSGAVNSGGARVHSTCARKKMKWGVKVRNEISPLPPPIYRQGLRCVCRILRWERKRFRRQIADTCPRDLAVT